VKISQFDLLDSSSERDDLIGQIRQLNDNRTDYPRNKTIHQVFQETADRSPNAIAVTQGDRSWTYRELDEGSNRIAHFLIAQHLPPDSVVAFLLDHTYDICTTVLGILKAGLVYLPIDEGMPHQRVQYLLNDSQARVFVSWTRHLRLLNSLQWDCPCLERVICLDVDDFRDEIEPEGEKMRQDVWDYVGEEMFDDISGGGWKNSFTGDWLSRSVMDEYGQNILTKLQPLLTPQTRVLEIGCSSGISMFRLAPLVGYYLGTDLSPTIMEKSEEERRRLGLDNVRLKAVPAHDVDTLDEAEFDIVIVNSVVQYFSGHNYLRSVLAQAIALMKPKGWLFLGNLFDRDLRDGFLDDLDQYERTHRDEEGHTKTDYSDELFINRAFLDDLRFDLPQIADIEYSELLGHEASELREFTFDALMRIDRHPPGHAAGKRIKHQFGRSSIDTQSAAAVEATGTAQGPAYIMYTSGTTGKPKGVMVPHRAVNRLVINTNFIRITPRDRMLQTGALGFDASTFELWGALLNGAQLSRPPEKSLLDLVEMKRLIREQGTTILWLTSSLFNQYADWDITVFEGLRTLLIGGEKLSNHHVDQVRRQYPELCVINGYGPTENTTFTTCHHIDQAYTGDIPIGNPVANTEVWILDEAHEPVAVGGVGEICAGGDGLALGYLNDPELTAQRFIDHPFTAGQRLYRTGDLGRWLTDGTLEFRGRTDTQVKVRGHRVETGEIETHINRCDGVTQAVVTASDPGDGIQILAGYVTGTEAVTVDQIRHNLRQELPEYMIPSYLVVLDQLPLTANGKVDRHRLPQPSTDDGRSQSPRLPLEGPIEETLGQIWKETLDVREIGATDSFFDAGGHSLKISKMITAIQKHFGIEVSLATAFRSPTIRGLAEALSREARFGIQEVDDVLVPLSPAGGGPAVFAFPPGTGDVLSYVQLAHRLEGFRLHAFQFITSETRISDYADHIESVKTSGPLLFIGYSYGGNLAFRVAQEMERRNRPVHTVVMIDSSRRRTKVTYPEGEAEQIALDFMDHESLRARFTNDLLRQKVCRQIHAYYHYSSQTVESGVVQADLHVILSDNAVTEHLDTQGHLVADTAGWTELTSGSFTTYAGEGAHNLMLYEPALDRNVQLIQSILTDATRDAG